MATVNSGEVPQPNPSAKDTQKMQASAPPMEPYSYIPPMRLEGDQLKSTIEYFLSRTYLEGDQYLVSQMNTDLYLPVEALVERITTWVCPVEFADVILAIESSKEVSLDASKTLVRPNFTLARNTIILRDLAGVTEKEVHDLFNCAELTSKPTEVTKEVGDCWFVTFDSEPNAVAALSYIRKQNHNGVPIHARLKQESLLRSSNVIEPVPMSYYPPDMYSMYGVMDYDPQMQYEPGMDPYAYADPTSEGARGGAEGKDQRKGHRFGRGGGGRYRKGRDANPGAGGVTAQTSTSPHNNPNGANEAGRHGFGHRNRPSNRYGGGRKRANSAKRGPQTSINLGLAHFPPLHAQDKPKSPQNIKKWAKQDIVDVIHTLGDLPPRSSELPADCIAVLAAPNVAIDVLKPLPRLETLDLSKGPAVKGPDYKAVAAKPTNATDVTIKPPKAAKHVAKPPNATIVSGEKDKTHEKKKGPKGKKGEGKRGGGGGGGGGKGEGSGSVVVRSKSEGGTADDTKALKE